LYIYVYSERNADNDDDEEEEVLMSEYEKERKKELQRIKENLMNIGKVNVTNLQLLSPKKEKWMQIRYMITLVYIQYIYVIVLFLYSSIQLQNKPRSLL